MKQFLARHRDRIMGVISGFDRVLFRGLLRSLSYPQGLERFLGHKGVLLKNFGEYVEDATTRVKQASLAHAEKLDRPIRYLASSEIRKEDVARRILEKHPIDEGLICVLSCVEPCQTYELRRSKTEPLQLALRHGKCLHLYHYFLHPKFGFMHVRLQTWFPFTVQVCINGRLWLGRQLVAAGVDHVQSRNCFLWIDDSDHAQRLLDEQLSHDWPRRLDGLAREVNPALRDIVGPEPPQYYWCARQTEWATDVMFVDQASLGRIYPAIVHHAMVHTSCGDAMRFLGRRVHGNFQGEIVSDFKNRPEGIRVKHTVGWNSLKLYDKEGSVLRAETTMNDPSQFTVLRPAKGSRMLVRQPLRKSVVDLHRRAQVCQAANERYLDHFASLDDDASLLSLVSTVCSPAQFRGRRVRGLRPWAEHDSALLRAVNDGAFALRGFRNADIAARLFPTRARNQIEQSCRRARVTRVLQMLRAHSLIRRVPRSRRYMVTPTGRRIINLILTALAAPVANIAPRVDDDKVVLESFRHRDLAALIFKPSRAPRPSSTEQAKITRLLRALSVHELVRRRPGTHRYELTPPGKRLIAAFVERRQLATKRRRIPA